MCKRKNDCIPFLISLTLLIGGNIVFYVFTAPFFWTEIEGGPAAIVALAILLLFLLANLTWAVALDPGYFPQVAGDQRSVVGGGLTSLALFSGRDSG
jgi:hypothetical protein